MKTEDFDYELPENLIAQRPLDKRDASRLLVVDKLTGNLEHKQFLDIISYLTPDDLLVLNKTKVLPARLLGHKKDTGAKVEVFLVAPCKEDDTWECLVKPGKKIKEGTEIVFAEGRLHAKVISRTESGGRIISFFYEGLFMDVLSETGEVPLPPYIKEKMEDAERYQTVFAQDPGSVAAPTAGLHFTDDLLLAIKQKGVEIAEVTLHVGIGTFRPVSATTITEHKMHEEFFSIDAKNIAMIEEAFRKKKRIVSVGTTSTRTLESAMEDGKIIKASGWTNIFIYPGYQFKAIDALITNFHLPKSTLLMLVSAMAGTDVIKEAYKQAIEKEYRFFSFGDAMFIK